MQKIKIVAVGKIKNNLIKQEIDEFLKRLGPYATVSIHEMKDEGIKKESEKIILQLNEYSFALDAEGKQTSSVEFSDFLKKYRNEELIFIIGGPEGFTDDVRLKAKTISLSKMTFTHEMARLLLVEQIYRGFMIQNNKPYHK